VSNLASRASKKDHAYKLIRQSIISGELRPGEILNIANLSQKYSLGITPVREALIVLESEGFVDSLPRTGFIITSVTIQDILETFHLRTILEVEAIGLAVERIADEDIRALEANNSTEMQLGQTTNGNRRTQAYELNRDFHLIIARASGNRRLASLVEQFLDEMERMLAVDPYIADPEQHLNILRALKTKQKEAAQSAMKKHLDHTRSRIINRF
jgi:GntR family transcriptional regulator, rspAB operon transcriptional repressor